MDPRQPTRLFRGEFKVFIREDGSIVVPDLAEPLIPHLRQLGASDLLWQLEACAATTPVLSVTRTVATDLSPEDLKRATTAELWTLHDSLVQALAPTREPGHSETSLLDVKIELVGRILKSCQLCHRRCGVNRQLGQSGFCGLGKAVQVSAHALLYNEGPLVGAPTFSVFVRGCGLRCRYCYRSGDWTPDVQAQREPTDLARLLDLAVEAGAQSWHFLGGNPDSSLPGILEALALTRTRLPVVWNSSIVLSSEARRLLEGVVDIWICDYKFGNDSCAWDLAQTPSYVAGVNQNLKALQGEPWVVVRHPAVPGHEACCTLLIRERIQEAFPGFRYVEYPVSVPRR